MRSLPRRRLFLVLELCLFALALILPTHNAMAEQSRSSLRRFAVGVEPQYVVYHPGEDGQSSGFMPALYAGYNAAGRLTAATTVAYDFTRPAGDPSDDSRTGFGMATFGGRLKIFGNESDENDSPTAQPLKFGLAVGLDYDICFGPWADVQLGQEKSGVSAIAKASGLVLQRVVNKPDGSFDHHADVAYGTLWLRVDPDHPKVGTMAGGSLKFQFNW